MKYRLPVVAGHFYPSSPEQLNRELVELFADINESEIKPKALIVPHAGYYYSGAIAASAYACLKQLKHNIDRVIIFGPSHQCPLQGCATPSHDVFVTPLGEIPIDKITCNKLVQLGLAKQFDDAHSWEHSLEVQLPFLQKSLDEFQLVPITVGLVPPDQISKILNAIIEPSKTHSLETEYLDDDLLENIIVISTDLSHYHNYQQAQEIDANTISEILALNDNIQPRDACGYNALNGFLRYCNNAGWKIKLAAHANSGDISGNKKEVVGYASFIAY